MIGGKSVRDKQASAREYDTLGRLTGLFGIFDIPESVTLEEGHIHVELLHVFRHDRLRWNDGPVHNGLHVLRLELGEHPAQVCAFLS